MSESVSEGRKLRNVFGQFASGVTVVTTTSADGTPHGATVTAFTSISLEPRLCQVTLTRTSKACAILADNTFAVNILASSQDDIALHFAGRPREEPIRWGDHDVAPSLCGNLATLWCRPWAQFDGGDHIIFLGEIVDAEIAEDRDPLLFFRSTFHDIGPTSHDGLWNHSGDDPLTGWFGATAELRPIN
ncbi:MAG: flavin reductase family protein [Corynebacterium pollutisoli]|uniref:Flavin reductase family protein n=1 Tax=Corynebacterium pollutisoli TaxID=1610489 RepID=A0A7X8MW83_9CORY|nr:flavin reductase family protein [Corynebacterium pollutisoli]